MTRLDVTQKRLGDFLDWSLTTISQTDELSVTEIAVLESTLQSLVNKHTHHTYSLNPWRSEHLLLCKHVCVCVYRCVAALVSVCLFETIVISA